MLDASCLSGSVPAGFTGPVIVSFSGGPDSVCLTELLRTRFDASRIILVYFNHQLRLTSTTEELPFVQSYALRHGHPLIIRRLPVRHYAGREKMSIEHAARHLRRRFLAHFSRLRGASFVFLGHHLDDFCETMVFQLARGVQLGPLGIVPETMLVPGVFLLRPLLSFSKQDILTYLSQRHVAFVLDESNADIGYDRNKIRHGVMPVLETLNTQFKSHFLSFARHHLAQTRYLMTPLKPLIHFQSMPNGVVVFVSRSSFLSLDSFLKPYLLHEMMSSFLAQNGHLKDSFFDLSAAKMMDLLRISTQKKTGTSLSVSEKVVFYVDYDRLMLSFRFERPQDWEYPLIEGETLYVPELKRRIQLDGLNVEDFTSFRIRNPRQGDVFCPEGSTHSRSLNRYFIEQKISKLERPYWGLLVSGTEIWHLFSADLKSSSTHLLKGGIRLLEIPESITTNLR